MLVGGPAFFVDIIIKTDKYIDFFDKKCIILI